MVEQQVNVEIVLAHLEGVLAADKGKPHAKFKQKVAEMPSQGPLQVAFAGVVPKHQEIEVVGVFR